MRSMVASKEEAMEPHYLFDEEAYEERYKKKEVIPKYDPDNIEYYMEVIEDGKKRKSLS
jgi:hypothetical protein